MGQDFGFGTGVLLAVFVVILILAKVLGGRRTEPLRAEFQQFAVQHGFQYVERDDSYLTRFDQLMPFNARPDWARNVLSGSYRGRPVCLFDLHYTTTESDRRYQIWVVGLPRPVPLFTAGSQGPFGGKVAEAFGYHRLSIGDPAFDDRIKIKCQNEPFGRRVLSPAVVDLLRFTGGWHWRLNGPNMISYQAGALTPATALPRLDLMCDLLDRIPADVWAGGTD